MSAEQGNNHIAENQIPSITEFTPSATDIAESKATSRSKARGMKILGGATLLAIGGATALGFTYDGDQVDSAERDLGATRMTRNLGDLTNWHPDDVNHWNDVNKLVNGENDLPLNISDNLPHNDNFSVNPLAGLTGLSAEQSASLNMDAQDGSVDGQVTLTISEGSSLDGEVQEAFQLPPDESWERTQALASGNAEEYNLVYPDQQVSFAITDEVVEQAVSEPIAEPVVQPEPVDSSAGTAEPVSEPAPQDAGVESVDVSQRVVAENSQTADPEASGDVFLTPLPTDVTPDMTATEVPHNKTATPHPDTPTATPDCEVCLTPLPTDVTPDMTATEVPVNKTPTPHAEATETPKATATRPAKTPTPKATPTIHVKLTPITATPQMTATEAPGKTPTPHVETPKATATRTATPTETEVKIATPTKTKTATPTESATATATESPTPKPTESSTPTPTVVREIIPGKLPPTGEGYLTEEINAWMAIAALMGAGMLLTGFGASRLRPQFAIPSFLKSVLYKNDDDEDEDSENEERENQQ